MTTVRPQPLSEGRFQLLEIIGEGGMATVYRAFDQRLQRPRAIKILSPAFAQRPALRRRFLSEAQTMANLEEARVVRVFDTGEDGDRVFIVMELVEGGSLVDRVKLHGPLPAKMACEVLIDLCESLHGAHENNVIHRDIKPHNVLLTRNGELRITDFGIAQVQHDNDVGMTRTGAVLGTWGFMAPEQKTNAKQVDARADIYSCGATLWSLLKNDTPPELFMGDSEPEWFADVPEPLAEVIRRSTRYRREERYPTARSMGDALRTVLPMLPENPDDTPPLVPRLPERPSNAEIVDTFAQLAGESRAIDPVATESRGRPTRAGYEGTMVPDAVQAGGTISLNDEPALRDPHLVRAETPEQRLFRSRLPIVVGALVALAVAAVVVVVIAPQIAPFPTIPLPPPSGTANPLVSTGPVVPEGTGITGQTDGTTVAGTDAATDGAAVAPVEPVNPDAGKVPTKVEPKVETKVEPKIDATGAVPPTPDRIEPKVDKVDAVSPPPGDDHPPVSVTKVAPGKLSTTAPSTAGIGGTVPVTANIGGRYTVKLYYRGIGAGAFREKAMKGATTTYSASFTVDDTMSEGIEYFVAATDVSGNTVRDGNAMKPLRIAVAQ